MPYTIQKLSLGGILDQATKIVKDHLVLFLTIMAITWLPFQLLSLVTTIVFLPNISASPTREEALAFLQAYRNVMPIILGVSLLAMVVSLPLTNAAIIYAVAEKYLGRPISAIEAVQRSLGKIIPLILTGILMFLAVMGGVILCVVPGILFGLWFGLAQHVVVLEDLTGVPALSRSKELVRPHLGQFLVLGLLVFIIAFLLGSGAAFVPQLHVRSAISILVNGVVTIFSTAVFVVFYFSCRCANDNFDLEHLAAAVDHTAAPPEAGEDPLFEER